ncbi:ATP-binding protein [Lachnospiraceae bacterium ZAX-1]
MGLSNAQYDVIMRQYEAKQIRNRHVAMKRIQEVYDRVPKLSKLDTAIAAASIAQARKLLDGEETALAVLKEQLGDLIRQKETLLVNFGYPHDYFIPPYDCKDCQDTGYIKMHKCHCFLQASIDLVYTQSNIKKVLEWENFNNFTYDHYSAKECDPLSGLTSLAAAKQAVAHSREFIDGFDRMFGNLFFYGDTGVGKTFLSNCIAKDLLESGHSVIYFSAFTLFDLLIKNAFEKGNTFEKNNDVREGYQNIFDCDLLIIDDLGTESTNSLTVSQLFSCLNERLLRRKSTIISTNLGLNQFMELYSERIFSRISSNYTMIKLFGEDIRIQKKLAKK